jgi:hypothetical protein
MGAGEKTEKEGVIVFFALSNNRPFVFSFYSDQYQSSYESYLCSITPPLAASSSASLLRSSRANFGRPRPSSDSRESTDGLVGARGRR